MRVRLSLFAIPLIPIAALVVGCGLTGGGAKVDAEHPTTVALVFVDVSKSTYGPGGVQRQRYAAAFAQIVRSLPGGTLLKADIIDSNPLSNSSLPISEYYEKYEGVTGNKNKFQVDQQHKAATKNAIEEFQLLLARRPTGDSILDSLEIAQNVFESFPSASTRYLVVFSDMIETSKHYRFTPKNLTPASVTAFIARERKAGLIPDLSGTTVYVVGAGATRGSDADPARTRAIREFWFRYFSATHAILLPARYGPTLIRFP